MAEAAPRDPAIAPASWHATDRSAWSAAFKQTDELFGCPARITNWSDMTQRAAQNAVTRFLSWARAHGDAAAPLRDIVRPEVIRAYVEERRHAVRTRTLASDLDGILATMEIVSPGDDWGWLRDIRNRAHRRARRDEPAARMIMHPAAVYQAGRQMMDAASAPIVEPEAFRDGLIVAMLISAPMRIGCFSRLTIGKHLRPAASQGWLVSLDDAETKTRRSEVWPIHRELGEYLTFYIETVRPLLLARARTPATTEHLWIGNSGQPIGDQVIRRIIKRRTGERFGSVLQPHSFRHSAVTVFGLECPGDPLRLSALLGHTSPETTQRHYVLSRRQLAQQPYLAALEKRRRRPACN